MFHSKLCRTVFTAGSDIVFFNLCNITGVVIMGGEWEEDGGSEVGGQAKGGVFLPLGHRQWCCAFSW